jgi:hypothetical protein
VAAKQSAHYRRIREEQERQWAVIDQENEAMRQLEQEQEEAVRVEAEMAARRAAHAAAKRRSQSRMLVHKGVQPCLRAAQARKREIRRQQQQQQQQQQEQPAIAAAGAKVPVDPAALSDAIKKAEGPSVSVVGWEISDATVRELASLPYDEWKEEMRARKREAEAAANSAAAAAANGTLAVAEDEPSSTTATHFSRRNPRQKGAGAAAAAKPRRSLLPQNDDDSSSSSNSRLSAAELAECTFHPRTGFPKAMALMRQVLNASTDGDQTTGL